MSRTGRFALLDSLLAWAMMKADDDAPSPLWVRVRSAFLRLLMRVGLWDVITEGGYLWQQGRFRVDFWNTERDAKARFRERSQAALHAQWAYANGWGDGHHAGKKAAHDAKVSA